MRRFIGWVLFVVGFWMFVSPQSILGLNELKWMYKFAFPGEVLLAIVIISAAYYALDFKADVTGNK